MQNDFLAREILPNCFTSDSSEISMEAEAKENFFGEYKSFRLHIFIIPYHQEIFNRKSKIFSPEKEKVPKTSKVFGKGLFVYDGNGLHSLRLQGLVGPVGRNARDAVENVKAIGQLTECGVGAVQVGRILVHNEELRACGVGMHGTGHGDHASGVLECILDTVGRKLTLDLITGAAHTRTGGIAALDHKARDDSVKDESVIEALVCKLDEIFYCDRRDLGIKLEGHRAAVFHFNDCFCHIENPF